MHWVKTPPTSEPITLPEAKAHLRVDGDIDDTYIDSLITVARQYVETYLCRAIMPQTWVYARDRFPCGHEMQVPSNITSLVGVTCEDASGTVTPFADVVADTRSVPGRVVLKQNAGWPSVSLGPINPVQVEYQTGYATVPLTVKQAILLLIGHWYENREAVAMSMTIPRQMAFAVSALLARERVYFCESR